MALETKGNSKEPLKVPLYFWMNSRNSFVSKDTLHPISTQRKFGLSLAKGVGGFCVQGAPCGFCVQFRQALRSPQTPICSRKYLRSFTGHAMSENRFWSLTHMNQDEEIGLDLTSRVCFELVASVTLAQMENGYSRRFLFFLRGGEVQLEFFDTWACLKWGTP